MECGRLVTNGGSDIGWLSDTSAETGRQWKSWLGMVLSCNGDACLAVMKNEAGIEWVSGCRL